MEQGKLYKNLEKSIILRRIRNYGFTLSIVLFLINAFMVKNSYSIFSEVGLLISIIGILYFLIDYKGY